MTPRGDIPQRQAFRLMFLLGQHGRRELGREKTCCSALCEVSFDVLGRTFHVDEGFAREPVGMRPYTFRASTKSWSFLATGWRDPMLGGGFRMTISMVSVTNREAMECDMALLEMAEDA